MSNAAEPPAQSAREPAGGQERDPVPYSGRRMEQRVGLQRTERVALEQSELTAASLETGQACAHETPASRGRNLANAGLRREKEDLRNVGAAAHSETLRRAPANGSGRCCPSLLSAGAALHRTPTQTTASSIADFQGPCAPGRQSNRFDEPAPQLHSWPARANGSTSGAHSQGRLHESLAQAETAMALASAPLHVGLPLSRRRVCAISTPHHVAFAEAKTPKLMADLTSAQRSLSIVAHPIPTTCDSRFPWGKLILQASIGGATAAMAGQ
ncbi:hypothetical protein NA57DRAFT_61866 [Rhizodiscina lignyota]|uniref:Uncharacterized protein n=1 Tax=Rhizodiscina lignyota TaxID=1504668 RepID=A0A9P4I4Y0_9PEZI|nr:hypothetical protein NA57DRAFT_61866 [Rhizodiscina lignyota]